MKHSILRTILNLDINGCIIQRYLDAHVIIDQMKLHSFLILNLHHDDNHYMNERIQEILNHSNLFDLSEGRVIFCHIRCQNLSDNILSIKDNDLILISIHHSVF